MDRVGFQEVIKTLSETIPKSKRFCSLSQSELIELWKQSTLFVHKSLLKRKSINFPGFGSFHLKKVLKPSSDDVERLVPCFVPSPCWDKVGAFNTQKHAVGMQAAEPLNFAAVARESGFSREEIEAALKDIVHAMFCLLKKGSNIVIPFTNVGKLYFQNKEIKIRFHAEFLDSFKTLSSSPSPKIESSFPSELMNEISSSTAPTSSISSGAQSHPKPEVTQTGSDSGNQSGNGTSSVENSDVSTSTPLECSEPTVATDAATEGKKLTAAGGQKRAYHTHTYSGDRLWSDNKCPICRTEAMTVVAVKDELVSREKEQDRLLLHLSLEVDRVHMRQVKEVEVSKLKTSISTAQYNHSKAQEQDTQRKSAPKNLPMGNLFEHREPPPDRIKQAKELARGLNDQMTIKLSRKLKEKAAKEQEDKELNNRLATEFKIVEIQSHLQKMQKRQQQQEALTEQIKSHALRQRELAVVEPIKENPFARSESLMFLYQKEKAKQLYQEQLAIIKQRQEYEARLAAMERQHSLERLALSRKELEKDLDSIKKTEYLARKSLENVWAIQKMRQPAFA